MTNQYSKTGEKVLEKCKKKNADNADVIIIKNFTSYSSCRLGELEEIEQSESKILGIRAFVGNKNAIISTSDFSESSINNSVEQVVQMAELAPDDPYSFIEEKENDESITNLDLYDSYELSAQELEDKAKEAENSALACVGIKNSNGASASQSKSNYYIANSKGFSGFYKKSNFSISCSVIAEKNGKMETDYDFDTKLHYKDLSDSKEIGKSCAKRVLDKCNPKKIKTCKANIIFEPRVARSIISHFSSAISGSAIARKSSFLINEFGNKIMKNNIRIIDNPLLIRGLSSRPFDAEGVIGEEIDLVKDGVILSWLLDNSTAKQLNMKTNGRASRSVSSPPSPSPTNLYLEKGPLSPLDLIKDVNEGFYITDLVGQGVNMVNGDYSRGAVGFKIENGEITFPVNEITIADNLLNMFKKMTPANDLSFNFGINSPTLLIEDMTVAGI
tara:strand:- start:287 stop:1621 length:1335 start_codon:yes stop_codon:yes gene_type:complete